MKSAASDPTETSPNTVPVAGGGAYSPPFLPRSRNAATLARDVGFVGQKRPAPQPAVTPFIAAESMAVQKGSESGTSAKEREKLKTPEIVAAYTVLPSAETCRSETAQAGRNPGIGSQPSPPLRVQYRLGEAVAVGTAESGLGSAAGVRPPKT